MFYRYNLVVGVNPSDRYHNGNGNDTKQDEQHLAYDLAAFACTQCVNLEFLRFIHVVRMVAPMMMFVFVIVHITAIDIHESTR